jgi:putative endonuclease
MPFVYILRCGDGTLYTGAAKDLARRLQAHAAGKAARYTRGRLPVELAWSAEAASWGAALTLERRIKRLTRARKLALIAVAGRDGSGEKASASRADATAKAARPADRGGESSGGRGPRSGSPRGSRRRGSTGAR